MATRFIDHLGDFRLGHRFEFGQPLIGTRFFDRVQVFALDILDQRQRHYFTVTQIAN